MMLHPDTLEKVADMATERVMKVVDFLVDNLIQDGQTYGDVPIGKPADYVAFYLDLEARGVTRALEVVNPKLATEYRRKFDRLSAEMMGLRNG